jgi:hypothetical protein
MIIIKHMKSGIPLALVSEADGILLAVTEEARDVLRVRSKCAETGYITLNDIFDSPADSSELDEFLLKRDVKCCLLRTRSNTFVWLDRHILDPNDTDMIRLVTSGCLVMKPAEISQIVSSPCSSFCEISHDTSSAATSFYDGDYELSFDDLFQDDTQDGNESENGIDDEYDDNLGASDKRLLLSTLLDDVDHCSTELFGSMELDHEITACNS